MGGLLVRRGATGHCDVYEALGPQHRDQRRATRAARCAARGGTRVEESVTVNRPAAELFRFWRNLDNLPRFMAHLESVERDLRHGRSHWQARGPGGSAVEWDAEIINEVPDSLIAWRSLDGSDVVSAGSVHFEDAGGDRGTRVRVRLQYSPPGGKLGTAVAQAARPRRRDARFARTSGASNSCSRRARLPTTEGQPRGQTHESSLLVRQERCRVEQVPDPKILNPRDAIIKITLTAICGSDLHLYDGFIPTMKSGDILGHEFMGEVVEVGSANHKLKVGDRVVVPFTIACGSCFFCKRDLWSRVRQLQPERLDGREALSAPPARGCSATRT